MANFQIEFKGKRAKKLFSDIVRNHKQITRAHNKYAKEIAPIFVEDVMNHFDKERGPNGRWNAWSKIYRERQKRRGKGGNKILDDTGRLKRGVSEKNWRSKGSGIVFYNDEKTASGFHYAQHHDQGRSSWRGNPRSFMWLSKRAMNKISKTTLDFLLKE